MLRIYDEFLEDETIGSLRDRAYRVHVSALIYCSKNLTDGKVTEKTVKVLQAILSFPVRRHVTELVEAELWVPCEDGYVIRNYLEFNPSASVVKKERAASRDRMRKLRERRAGSEEPSDERSGEHAGEGDGAEGLVPPHTGPVRSFEKPKGFSRVGPEQPFDESQLRETA